jgi:hypothetical protein
MTDKTSRLDQYPNGEDGWAHLPERWHLDQMVILRPSDELTVGVMPQYANALEIVRVVDDQGHGETIAQVLPGVMAIHPDAFLEHDRWDVIDDVRRWWRCRCQDHTPLGRGTEGEALPVPCMCGGEFRDNDHYGPDVRRVVIKEGS